MVKRVEKLAVRALEFATPIRALLPRSDVKHKHAELTHSTESYGQQVSG